MKMHKWIAVFVGVAVFSVAGIGKAPAANLEVGGEVYIGYYNKYLWRGFDLSGGKPVFQPGIDVGVGGFTFSFWSNIQQNDGELTETDITIDYTFSPHELVEVSVGNIFYNLNDVNEPGLKDTNELYLSVALDTLLAPALTIYWDYDEADSDGLFFTLSGGHSFAVMDNLDVNLGALISYNQASDYAVGAYRDFHNYELGISADYALTNQFVISPSFMFSSGISGPAKRAIDSEILAGINLAFSF
ncbi:hypothetical protein L9S41_07405 [Geoalkalibacter halelectricus]|uniref:MetA-pathway of phenol degradation n=1 Tax=Geoalkalibacter halelectricus TaxID=2847045 RepID=A0ABY5ZR94_9BACT|nr:hypothetical protein [Geoalkalibacter halelectricus]UWZ81206.1 hypothetical protein L9S41_07405 [Geoalkalibacter halelectricus]